MTERVTIDLVDGVADVRLNRPEKRNALDTAQFEAIAAALDTLASMAGVRCVVLSGAGTSFCVGLDLAQLMAGGGLITDLAARTHGPCNLYQYVAYGWRLLPMPVIAAVHGHALGGGFQIMLGADIRIAHPATQFSIMEARWGICPDMGGIALLRGLVRDDVARDLAYTARICDGSEAAAVGLVTRLADDPVAEAMQMARTIAAHSPAAMRANKHLFNMAPDSNADAILRAEADAQQALLAGPDVAEAVAAHMQKRSAVFRD